MNSRRIARQLMRLARELEGGRSRSSSTYAEGGTLYLSDDVNAIDIDSFTIDAITDPRKLDQFVTKALKMSRSYADPFFNLNNDRKGRIVYIDGTTDQIVAEAMVDQDVSVNDVADKIKSLCSIAKKVPGYFMVGVY